MLQRSMMIPRMSRVESAQHATALRSDVMEMDKDSVVELQLVLHGDLAYKRLNLTR